MIAKMTYGREVSTAEGGRSAARGASVREAGTPPSSERSHQYRVEQ